MARRGKSLAFLLPLKRAFERVLGWIMVGTLAVLRRINRQRMANVLGRADAHVGPWLPEHKIGRENLRAAFPEKSAAGDREDPRAACGTISAESRPSSRTSTASSSTIRTARSDPADPM